MGAVEIWNVGYREGYAFIGKIRSSGNNDSQNDTEVFTEKRSEIKSGVATATHMFKFKGFEDENGNSKIIKKKPEKVPMWCHFFGLDKKPERFTIGGTSLSEMHGL